MSGRTNSALSNAKRHVAAELRDATESEFSNVHSKTPRRMRGILQHFRFSYTKTFHTACYVEIEAASGPKASIAKRGEIDALLVQAAREHRHRPAINGAMHACNKDMRGSNALGAAPAFHRPWRSALSWCSPPKRTIGRFMFLVT